MRSQKFTINYIMIMMVLLLASLWLVGCSNSVSIPAPISSVNGHNNLGTTSNTIEITSLSNIIDKSMSQIHPQIQPVQSVQNFISSNFMQKKDIPIVYNRQYENIPRGIYTYSKTYTVERGDTLFYISWITGNDFYDLAQRNNIQSPYNLNIGQKLQLANSIRDKKLILDNDTIPITELTTQNYIIKTSKKVNKITIPKPTVKFLKNSDEHKNKLTNNTRFTTAVKTPVTTSMVNSTKPISNNVSYSSPYLWLWPTEGRIIEKFSSSEKGNKGIDIAGNKGQDIVATADGRIVYAGSALRGYGNLIIIKHNDNYLSAYAHNDEILVREQQEVKKGQKIATMGHTGTNSTRLHFEIRYKGKSVNPLHYLPRR